MAYQPRAYPPREPDSRQPRCKLQSIMPYNELPAALYCSYPVSFFDLVTSEVCRYLLHNKFNLIRFEATGIKGNV